MRDKNHLAVMERQVFMDFGSEIIHSQIANCLCRSDQRIFSSEKLGFGYLFHSSGDVEQGKCDRARAWQTAGVQIRPHLR